MKKKLCPQCKIGRFYIKDNVGNTMLVLVDENFEIIPIKSTDLLESFNTDTLYCLGCSWQGNKQKLKNY